MKTAVPVKATTLKAKANDLAIKTLGLGLLVYHCLISTQLNK